VFVRSDLAEDLLKCVLIYEVSLRNKKGHFVQRLRLSVRLPLTDTSESCLSDFMKYGLGVPYENCGAAASFVKIG
jgi:hypothetical protein